MILIKTEITEERPFDVTVRAWPKMKTRAHAAVGAYWHRRIFPRHFKFDAKNKYGHQKRTIGYQIRKQRMARKGKAEAPGTVDNVLTGRMRESLSRSMTVRSFPTRATVKMEGPRYALMRPFKSGQPNKGRELTTVTREEAAVLEQVLLEAMERELKQFRAKRKTKI